MAGNYKSNLSFIQWIYLTVDGLWIFQPPLTVSAGYFPYILCSAVTESTTRTPQVSGKWAWWPCFSPLSQGHRAAAHQHCHSQPCTAPLKAPAGHHSLPGHVFQPNPVSSTSVVSVEELKASSVFGELLHSKGTFLSVLQCLSTSGDVRQLLSTCTTLRPN